MPKVSADRIVKVIMVVIFGYFAGASLLYPANARIIPLIITLCGASFAIINLFGPRDKDDGRHAPGQDAIDDNKKLPHSEGSLWGWMLFFFGGILLFGLIAGSSLFLFFFLKWFWKEKWTTAIFVAIGTGFSIFILFHGAFRMELYSGIFFDI